jgi:ribosomal protein S18 acetylase RimI-like enzyme
MASTDSADRHAPIRPLSAADVPAALQLSASAQWNQNAHDWRTMLQLGQGWGIDDAETPEQPSQLAASVIALPYGRDFAWVSMVLVLPAFRRRGHAQRLLRHVLQHLRAQRRGAVLDATPAGHAVYVQEGMVDTWGFARYRREAGAAPPSRPGAQATRPLRDSDWPAIEAMDTPAFGASRTALLRTLAQRWPQAARVAETAGQLRGFVLGRDGREAHQVGPLLADDEGSAQALLGEALAAAPGAVYVDLLDRQARMQPWLAQCGFVLQRPFTRMVHGIAHAPGDPAQIVLAAGPELG